MSESEDSQSSTKLRDEDYLYRLRRIGPPATCSKVPDVMSLNLGLTRIGRGQHNDYYLDSAVLKNFISRSHVEIVGTKNENGEIEFVLNDKGLNGTFINDIRTHKTCVLEIGDKITFGHTNGYKIQAGSHAEQPNSEFQFIFEKIPKSAKTSEIYQEGLSSETYNRQEASDAVVDQKKDLNVDRSFLSDIQSNLQTQEKTAKAKLLQKDQIKQDSGSQSDNDVKDAKLSSTTRGSSRRACKITSPKLPNSDLTKTSQSKESIVSKRKTSSNTSVLSETVPAVTEPDEPDDEAEEEVEEEEGEEEEKEGRKKVPKKKKPVPAKKMPVRGKKAPEPPSSSSSSSESSSEDDDSKPEADQRPKSRANNTTRQKQLQQKRKKSPATNSAPAVGSRKRRRKTATTSTDDNLEPGVEWYEDETCDSADCKRPKKKRTSWVQCDDCDGWYHTVCVGANYDLLKDSDAHFNCGCVQD